MFRYTDDPVADAEAYYNELARLEEQVPRCCEHPGPVMENFYYELNDDRPVCAECLDKNHKLEIEEGQTLVCDYCEHAIEDDCAYRNDDDEVFCKACVDKHFRKEVVVE
ncbi:MAG: hypothetical protein IKY90_07225 [Oscillospiraceae bacterium]|nr:hypothetical protein [Oscillospiraceae bacterium]